MALLRDRIGASNERRESQLRRDVELDNSWKDSPSNHQLYQICIRMQEPQKLLHIYKNITHKLVTICEPYALHLLENPRHVSSESRRVRRGYPYSRPGDHPDDILRWYQHVLEMLKEWSPYDPLLVLLNREQMKKAVFQLFRSIPSDVRSRASADITFPAPSPQLDFEETAEAVRWLLSSKDEFKVITRLKEKDAQSFIDLLDQTMDHTEINDGLYAQCLRILRKLCGRSGLLPASCMLSEGLDKNGTSPRISGGFADIWLGNHQERAVALKVLRIYGDDNLKVVKKSFCREAVIWKRLSHPNILPFLGVSTTLFPLCMVCEWMTNGNIAQFLKKNPSTNRLELLADIAKGLQYLHSIGILHGDLKGANILIDDKQRACLSDFGLTAVTYDPNTVNAITTTSTVLGSIRWMAPEMLHPENAGLERFHSSAESDIYAYAMVLWEVFAGNVPFCEFPRDATVMFKVTLGIRPERPSHATALGLSDMLWSMTEMCWQQEWRKRPRIPFVLQCLEEALRQFVPSTNSHQATAAFDDDVEDGDSSDEEEAPAFKQDFTLSREGEASQPVAFPTTPQTQVQFANSAEFLNIEPNLERLVLQSPSPPNAAWADEQAWF